MPLQLHWTSLLGNIGTCEMYLANMPATLQVDVWATGILAYELVVGRPPFEVNDEVQTATMIMFSNNIPFPPKYTALWADFVKVALEKKPHVRPTALQMLDHPWYGNILEAIMSHGVTIDLL